jgi:hypothetical protein
VVAGDVKALNTDLGISFKCPKNDTCRDDVKTRLEQALTALGGVAAGGQLIKFTTTTAGTLPIVATWNNRFKYTVNGQPAFAKQVAIDLAPRLVGQPAYAMIQNDDGTLVWYTVPDLVAQSLLDQLYNLPVAPAPTVDPTTQGGGTVFYNPIYTLQYNNLLLGQIQFSK